MMLRNEGHDLGIPNGTDATHRLSVLLTEENHVVAKGHAFLRLFLKAERRIFAYILTLLPHRADAEDVLQEVSAILWEKFDERNPPENFVAWGCRIAYFQVRVFRRRKQRQRVLFSEAVLEHVAETLEVQATALQLAERIEALDRCFQKLGRRDRELLAERLKAGATTESTAERIGRSVDTIYKAMARIRKAVHDCVTMALETES